MDILIIVGLGGGILGFIMGMVGGGYKWRQTLKRERLTAENLRLELAGAQGKWETLTLQNQGQIQQQRCLQEQVIELERRNIGIKMEKLALDQRMSEHQQDLTQLQEKFSHQFENLAHKIFSHGVNGLQQESSKQLSHLLEPLKDRILEFQKKVEDTYHQESRERFGLKQEIEKVVACHQKITAETHNLTRALKGDVKVQGNWGEMVLERVLQGAGLREGEEFVIQGKGLKLKNSAGQKQQPDVVINLPAGKHIIVDAKVSLIHYNRMIESTSEEEKKQSLKELMAAIRSHVEGLSGKEYHLSEQLVSPDFTLMFFPIEGAFSIVLHANPEIFSYAWEKSIIIVSPTTLLATLRTVASVWKQEKQNRNAMQIARESGRLYDKFVGFVDDLEKVGDCLKKTDQSYHQALNKLSRGQGNIISKVEHLKQLGAKTSKQFSGRINTDPVYYSSKDYQSKVGLNCSDQG